MEDNALIKPFEETLYTANLQDVTVDFAEIALDAMTKLIFENISDAFVKLPIIKTIVSLGTAAWDIRKAVTTRNQLAFIMTLKNGKSDPAAVEKRRTALEKHEKWVEQEIELSAVFLDRYTNVRKAVYQARIYADLLEGKITFSEYEEYLMILDQLLVGDIVHLLDVIAYYVRNQEDFYNSDLLNEVSRHFDRVRCGRLESLGLLAGLITSRVGTSTVDRYIPTDQGIYLYTVTRENDEKHPKIILNQENVRDDTVMD